MDAQWLNRIAGSHTIRYLEEQHQIPLWSENGANILSLWSVLFVESFFSALFALMPITLFYVPALMMAADELNHVVDLIYVILSNAIMHFFYAAFMCLVIRHLFGSRIAAIVSCKLFIPIFFLAEAFSLPILFDKKVRLWIQRSCFLWYLFGFGYVDRNANRLLPFAENDMHRKLLADGTGMAMFKGTAGAVIVYNLILLAYPAYVAADLKVQLFVRLIFVSLMFFASDFIQIYSLMDLPLEHMEKRMDIVSLVNSYARLHGRLMIGIVNKDDYENNMTAMCIGLLVVDVFNRSTYNIRYHAACQFIAWWRSLDISTKTILDTLRICITSPFRRMGITYGESNQKPIVSHSRKKNQVQRVQVENSQQPQESQRFHVREVQESEEEDGGVMRGPSLDNGDGDGTGASDSRPRQNISQRERVEINRDVETKDEILEEAPFALPSPLREMRVRQITDNVSSEIRVAILISFFLFFMHRLFPPDVLYTPSTFVECFYLLGIQVIFEFLSDLISFYIEIYYYKLPLDISYKDFKDTTLMTFLFSLFSVIGFQSFISYLVDFHYHVEE